MSYQYTDSSRETEPTALPDVEVFEAYAFDCDHCDLFKVYPELTGTGYMDCPECGEIGITDNARFYYAYGFPGCLWDGEPEGPFDTAEAALTAAREAAGFCRHGLPDDDSDDPLHVEPGCADCARGAES